MAATVLIRQLVGTTPGTPTDKTSGTVRFDKADTADNTSLANPIPVPGAGQEYSMRRVLRAYVSAGSYTQITGLEMYSDGSNGFGTGRKMWVQNPAVAGLGTYAQPTIPSISDDPPHFPGANDMVDWFGYTSGAPYDLENERVGPFTPTTNGDGAAADPKEIGDFINMVFEVETTSVQGITPSETLTVRWQEI